MQFKLQWILLIFFTVVITAAIEDECLKDLPSSLAFVEPLDAPLLPRHIILFSGSHSYLRRTMGFGGITSEQLTKFSDYHGYRHIFLDELPFRQNRTIGNVSFAYQWLRVFAMPSLRTAFPWAKYFVWMDDDVLIPYAETDMLNHYVNVMERDPECHLLIGGEDEPYTMNTGFFIQRNSDLVFDAWHEAILEGLKNDARLAHHPIHEQGAIVKVMRRHGWDGTKIRRMLHREAPHYNFNTFILPVESHHWPGTQVEYGDAFVHWIGIPSAQRETGMRAWMEGVEAWRRSKPGHCSYPIQANTL